ncbi:hypothetical protein NL676_024145 [Syzygium grande]|nr:hypothetical protein NL676_024145 [Syzygium grande]
MVVSFFSLPVFSFWVGDDEDGGDLNIGEAGLAQTGCGHLARGRRPSPATVRKKKSSQWGQSECLRASREGRLGDWRRALASFVRGSTRQPAETGRASVDHATGRPEASIGKATPRWYDLMGARSGPSSPYPWATTGRKEKKNENRRL